MAEMPNATLTCIDFWIKAGSVNESPEEEGIAHFLEHMVFKGSKNLEEGDFDREIEELGGSSNAATGFDDVHFHVLVPPENSEKALDLLFNLVLTPAFESNAFETEREVVLEEIAQYNDQPDEKIFQQLLEMSWLGHQYGKPILGSKKSLNKLSPKKMRIFHDHLYNKNNIALSIAGKIPKRLNNSLLRSVLVDESKNSVGSSNDNKSLVFQKQRKEIRVERIEACRLLMAWPIPPATEQKNVIGYDIATTLLAEGRRSLLIHHLREDLQIVDSIDMDITCLEQGGIAILEANCSEDKLNLVEKEIYKILKQIINKPLNEKDFKRAQKIVKNSLCFGLEIPTNVASITGSQLLWGRHQSLLKPLKDIDYWEPETLINLILSELQPDKCSVLIAKPK